MNVIVRDLVLSGMVYVILTYLTFRLMRKKTSGNNNDDDGGQTSELQPPHIDLPPGISWPGPVKDRSSKKELEEELA